MLLRGVVAVIGALAGLLGLGLISLSPRMSWGLRAVVGVVGMALVWYIVTIVKLTWRDWHEAP